MLGKIIESAAEDKVVLSANPNAERTSNGVSHARGRVQFCLERRGTYDDTLVDFVENDINDVVALFQEFNDGTHGGAARFDLQQLTAIKKRVEDVVRFLYLNRPVVQESRNLAADKLIGWVREHAR